MQKISIVVMLIFLIEAGNLFGQANDLKHLGTLKTDAGKRIELYDNITKGQGELTFHNEKGKLTNVDWKHIEWMQLGERKYIRHAKKDNAKDLNLLEILAQSDKYQLLRMELSSKSFIYIFDMNNHLLEEMTLFLASGGGAKANNEKVEKTVSTYFSTCGDFVKKMEQNLKQHMDIFEGLGYFACEGAPDLGPLMK